MILSKEMKQYAREQLLGAGLLERSFGGGFWTYYLEVTDPTPVFTFMPTFKFGGMRPEGYFGLSIAAMDGLAAGKRPVQRPPLSTFSVMMRESQDLTHIESSPEGLADLPLWVESIRSKLKLLPTTAQDLAACLRSGLVARWTTWIFLDPHLDGAETEYQTLLAWIRASGVETADLPSSVRAASELGRQQQP